MCVLSSRLLFLSRVQNVMFLSSLLAWIQTCDPNYVMQELAIFFCKRPEDKYFQLIGIQTLSKSLISVVIAQK